MEPASGQPIDQGLVLWFPGPRSETGEDMAELQTHGSRAVVSALFDSLSRLGLRLAEPGEFAKRAFRNGKLDLTQVEGLADLVAAETDAQRRQALGQAGGRLSRLADDWRNRLIGLRAELEAQLDFSDEGDVVAGLPDGFFEAVERLAAEMRSTLEGSRGGERLREGFRVALLGAPNAGKSTLLNVLARRDVAIVTAEPGTTRDVLEVPLDLGGLPIVVYDTAGIREADSEAEREGVRRARRAGAAADLVLWLEDGAQPQEIVNDVGDAPVWRVRTKMDLAGASSAGGLGISALSGAGMAELLDKLGMAAAEALGRGDAVVSRQRQREAIAAALAALDGVRGAPEEIAADLLRSAGEAISRLTGRIDVEDVLDRLFAEFCIGK
jgi:tRNA modification GTPase